MGCCFQDLFNTALGILLWFPYRIFSIRFVLFHVMKPNNRMDTIIISKKSRFTLSERSDSHMIDNLAIGGDRGVMVIVVGNGHGDTSSNPGRD